jgi:adhesin transport system membrane fusion protein
MSPAPMVTNDATLPVMATVQSPWAVTVLAIVVSSLLVATVVGLVVTPWQQSVPGQGRVIALSPAERHQRLESPVDGRISRVLVVEGQQVETDEIVVEVEDVDPRFLERLQSEAELVRVREQAASSRRQSVEDRVSALVRARELGLTAADARIEMGKERVRQAEQAVVAAEAASRAAALNLPRVRELAAQGLRSTRDLELAELDQSRAAADEQRARAALMASTSEVASLTADRRRVEQETTASINDARAAENSASAEQAAVRADIVRLDTRIARQLTQAVRVPRGASVFRVLVQEGQLVKQGDSLVELVPLTTSRAVEIWVDGNDAPLVGVGRPVRVQFEGWPALQLVGWPRAARGTFGGVVTLVDIHDDGAGRFRVVVGPDPNDPSGPWPTGDILRQGVRANGWVLLDQVPLGQELWRRLNAFPPSVKDAGKSSAAGTDPGRKKAR